MKTIFLILVMTTAAHAGELTSRKGECAVTVPDSWKSGLAPDHKIGAVVSTWWGVDTFAEAKTEAKKRYKGKVVKETDTELDIEGPSELDAKVTSVHRSIAVGKKMCAVEVIHQAGALEDARKLAHTLVAK